MNDVIDWFLGVVAQAVLSPVMDKFLAGGKGQQYKDYSITIEATGTYHCHGWMGWQKLCQWADSEVDWFNGTNSETWCSPCSPSNPIKLVNP